MKLHSTVFLVNYVKCMTLSMISDKVHNDDNNRFYAVLS